MNDNPSASAIKGVLVQPIFNCIEPCCCVPPLLHMLLGVTNDILNQFHKCTEIILEKIPPELQKLKLQDLEAEEKLIAAMEQMNNGE